MFKRVYIDRDPYYFPIILNFMRGYKRPQDLHFLEENEVRAELDFYLENILSHEEKILLPSMKTISSWISKKINWSNLIYKATRYLFIFVVSFFFF